MKNRKTKSYQNKNLKIAQNRHEPIQTLGNRPYQKHTRKRKTRNFGTVRLLERTTQTPTSSLKNMQVGASEATSDTCGFCRFRYRSIRQTFILLNCENNRRKTEN